VEDVTSCKTWRQDKENLGVRYRKRWSDPTNMQDATDHRKWRKLIKNIV